MWRQWWIWPLPCLQLGGNRLREVRSMCFVGPFWISCSYASPWRFWVNTSELEMWVTSVNALCFVSIEWLEIPLFLLLVSCTDPVLVSEGHFWLNVRHSQSRCPAFSVPSQLLLKCLAAVVGFRSQFGRNCSSGGTAWIHNRVSSFDFLAFYVSFVAVFQRLSLGIILVKQAG